MAVVRVGKQYARDEILEAGDDGVANMGVHEAPGAFEALGRQVRAVAK